ncbi:LADA_0C04412g1_1 [Lachancea dasiensis]|uniref:Vacuolar protein-sorting-associated protein 36 n=1 Tax=Lachancea dasiensis TaxID=1072105 RepID=A0A1G4IYT7_9SACH|nr:LADA_0C04412g1_1 [Lachancea dasiensis]
MRLRQWHFVETTGSGQPILRENEKDIYIEHPVGCYQGKSKILGKQKGRVYLTSQRIIYIDDEEPTKNSVSLELDDVAHVEYSSKFLRKSARLSIFLKNLDPSEGAKVNSAKKVQQTTSKWPCPICDFENETNETLRIENMSLFSCANCGITPDFDMIKDLTVLKAPQEPTSQVNEVECSACTFLNHPSLTNCEICGTRLPVYYDNVDAPHFLDCRIKIELQTNDGLKADGPLYIQLSFRESDGMLLSQTIEELIENQPREDTKNVYNIGATSINESYPHKETHKETKALELETKLGRVGIASLEKSQEDRLRNNDIILGSALSDLNNLMALASDIEQLYGKTARDDVKKKPPLFIVDREKFLTKELFIKEISRELHGFIMTEFQKQMEVDGVILISLVDIYALYNKAMRIGSGLVSPQELKEACSQFQDLGLKNLHLTKINGRVLCISSGDSFGYIKKRIIDIVTTNPGADLLGLTQRLNENDSNSWTAGIIMEVLSNCVSEGQLLIDEQITGVQYYVNFDWKI